MLIYSKSIKFVPYVHFPLLGFITQNKNSSNYQAHILFMLLVP